MIEGYKASTLALPTFSDDQALFGDSTPADCAKRISSYGVKEIVVKDGGNPCVVSLDAKLFSVTPEPVRDIVDTTGAGDAWAAGFLYGYLRGYSLPASGNLGSLLGGETVQHLGPVIPDMHWPRLRAHAESQAKA